MTDLDPPPIDLLDGIMTTRALRRYTDEPVSDNDLWTILRAAQQGPSGGNIQPWQFVVVTDDEPKAKLGEIYRSSYYRYEAAMLAMSPPRRPEDEPSWQRTIAASRHLADHFGEAPANLKACDETTDKNHCTTFSANDQAFYDKIAFWATPTRNCRDGRGNVCVDYSKWVQAWTDIKG